MSRRQRQADELLSLCAAGAVCRAVDLAFEHFAAFGRDEAIIDRLADAVATTEHSERARQRFAELCASHD